MNQWSGYLSLNLFFNIYASHIVLNAGHGREKNTVDGGIDICNESIGNHISPVIKGHTPCRIHFSYNQLTEIVVDGYDQCGDQDLPAVGEQITEALSGKHKPGTPPDNAPENQRVHCGIEKVPGLPVFRRHNLRKPYLCPKSCAYGASQESKEKASEQKMAGYICLLHIF